jgi:hypothetical protein
MNRRAVRPVLLALLLVAPAAASAPPVPVCGVCGDAFASAAEDAGVDLDVDSCEVLVRVDETGTGRWTARATVNPAAAEAFGDDPALLDRIVRETFENGRFLVADDARGVSARLDGDAVVVTFDAPEMAHDGVGDVLLALRIAFWNGGVVAWTLAAQFAALGLVAARRPESLAFRRLLAAAVVPPVAAAGVASVVADANPAWGAAGVVPLAVTVALFLPLGYAERRSAESRPLLAAIVAAPVVFTVPTLPIGGFGPAFMALFLLGWVLLTLAVGLLVYRLGRTLAATADANDSDGTGASAV